MLLRALRALRRSLPPPPSPAASSPARPRRLVRSLPALRAAPPFSWCCVTDSLDDGGEAWALEGTTVDSACVSRVRSTSCCLASLAPCYHLRGMGAAAIDLGRLVWGDASRGESDTRIRRGGNREGQPVLCKERADQRAARFLLALVYRHYKLPYVPSASVLSQNGAFAEDTSGGEALCLVRRCTVSQPKPFGGRSKVGVLWESCIQRTRWCFVACPPGTGTGIGSMCRGWQTCRWAPHMAMRSVRSVLVCVAC